MRSTDPATVLGAVMAAGFIGWHEALRRQANAAEAPPLEALRPLLLPFLESPDGDLRCAAAEALRAVGVGPEDLPRLLALEGDARLRWTLPHLLRQAAGEPVPAGVREVVLRLLDDPSASVVDHTLAAFGTTDLGPEYMEKVIALAGRPATSRSAISRVLAPLDEKPDRVIDLLLEAVLSQEEGVRDSAIDALKSEVRRRDRVADFFLRLLQCRDGPGIQARCLEVLDRCGRKEMIPVLQAWASEVEPSPWVRARLDRAIAALSGEPDRTRNRR
jgi:HEAT repeat protein